MTIQKTQYGSIKATTMHKGYLIQRYYFVTSIKQAKKNFIQELKNI